MQNACQDSFYTTFSSYLMIDDYHREQAKNSKWVQCKVKDLVVEPLDQSSPLFAAPGAFAPGISPGAVKDTAENLGLALRVEGERYPVRTTAYKTLLERAKINGTVLPKLKRSTLSEVLNVCLAQFSGDALVLIRDEKVSAVHSGDETDYSVLPIDKLLETLKTGLDARFPGNVFAGGYSDHAMSSATWKLPDQKEDLIGTYTKHLAAQGKKAMSEQLMPGIRFTTSDTGVSSAKVSALLFGFGMPILIGSCVDVDHRNRKTVTDFEKALDQLFAQFGDTVERLNRLLETPLDYPVNAMTRICKKFSMPKKAAIEAIRMFETSIGPTTVATAHDVFVAMQEIVFTLKSEHAPESKVLALQENMARVLTLDWSEFDLAKGVDY